MNLVYLLLMAALLPFAMVGADAQDAHLTPLKLQTALQADPKGADAEKLAAAIRQWIGADELKKGSHAKVDGLTAAWAIEAPGAKSVKIVLDHGKADQDLTRIGTTDVYALALTLPEMTGFEWAYDVDGKRFGSSNLEAYAPNPEMQPNPNAPKGKLTEMPLWRSKIFPDTERHWWVYVPAQYTPDKPACVMVFQDGGGYKNYVPTAFDNLIAKGEMPVTVGIFLDPGNLLPGAAPRERGQRSFEYDTLSDQYARFLLEEILPEVEKTTKLRHDAASRAIGGLSSGAICAWTVAWERPTEFSKVLSWIGSYTGLAGGPTMKEGGNNYPVLIRRTPPKPIRIFLQDGENDLDNDFGYWPLANQEMAKALAYKKYDYRFEFGHGFHSDQHGRSILPDSLRWLWREYKAE